MTGIYQYKNPRAKRDHIGTVQESEETETDRERQTDREREREKKEKTFSLCRQRPVTKERLMTQGGVEPSTFRLKSICSTD